MAESNLARSLFSGPSLPPLRKKNLQTNPQEPQVPECPPEISLEVSVPLARKEHKLIKPQVEFGQDISRDICMEVEVAPEFKVEAVQIEATSIATFDIPKAENSQPELTANLESDLKISYAKISDLEIEVAFKSDLLEIELDAFKLEMAALRSQDKFKQEYIEQLEAEILETQASHNHAIGILKSQLEQSESVSQALQISLSNQIVQNSWQQQEALQRIAQTESALAQLNAQLELETARQFEQIDNLQQEIDRLTTNERYLQVVLKTTHENLSECTKNLQSLQSELGETKRQKDELEAQVSRNQGIQALLQNSLQDAESQEAIAVARTEELELQVKEMQEQVLKQSGQASEYEAAVQHWKEQSVRHQHHALQLSAAIERLLESKPTPKYEAPIVREETIKIEEKPLVAIGRATIELPAFLKRSRSLN
jgi:hypothetical protein